MTDSEMTRICADMLGTPKWVQFVDTVFYGYLPLHNSGHAMDLVKGLELNIGWETASIVHVQPSSEDYPETVIGTSEGGNLNYAIVYCVVEMWKYNNR